MSAVNRLNNNLLFSSQLTHLGNTHNSSSEKIEIIWRNLTATKRLEISCPRVQDKSRIFKKLEGGKVALRHTTWYKIKSFNPDLVLKNKDFTENRLY